MLWGNLLQCPFPKWEPENDTSEAPEGADPKAASVAEWGNYSSGKKVNQQTNASEFCYSFCAWYVTACGLSPLWLKCYLK